MPKKPIDIFPVAYKYCRKCRTYISRKRAAKACKNHWLTPHKDK